MHQCINSIQNTLGGQVKQANFCTSLSLGKLLDVRAETELQNI